MSEQFKGFVVMFGKPVSEEYMDKVKDAIKLFQGVIDVSPSVENADDWMNKEQVRRELRKKLLEVIY